ncbi:MAG: hypothetical protein J6Y93_05730 [Treponema sp.]|nr:hypothetical protein [Treponema sp.]
MKKYILLVLTVLFISCSSSKRPMLVTTVADQADVNYETANSMIAYGRFEEAREKLESAWQLAMSIDDQYLLTRICYSYVSYDLMCTGVVQAEDKLELSRKHFSRCNENDRKMLAGVYEICLARIKSAKKDSPDESIKTLEKLRGTVKEKYYLGYLMRTLGDLYAEKSMWSKADECYLEAAGIHIKERYLSEIGLDYYSSARVRSLAGNKQKAVESVELALQYDRSAENTAAIGLDYMAYARILLKEPSSEADRKKALDSARWARDIFESGGLTEEVEKTDTFLQKLQ